MACEKGATYLDKLCHKFYGEPKGHGEKTDYVCRLCGGPLETYYCEERLYLVRCVDCGTLALVKTANPRDSARVTLARPTLTPPNEPLSVLVNDEPDREYIDYICPRCKSIISQRRRGQRMETVYKCKFHDNCGQRVDWSNPQPYRRPPEGEA